MYVAALMTAWALLTGAAVDSSVETAATVSNEARSAPGARGATELDIILFPIDLTPLGNLFGELTIALDHRRWWTALIIHTQPTPEAILPLRLGGQFGYSLRSRTRVHSGGMVFEDARCRESETCVRFDVPDSEVPMRRTTATRVYLAGDFFRAADLVWNPEFRTYTRTDITLFGGGVSFVRTTQKTAVHDPWGRASNRMRRTVSVEALGAIPANRDLDLFSPVGVVASLDAVTSAPVGLALRFEGGAHPVWGPYFGISFGVAFAAIGFDANDPVSREVYQPTR
jgi:hypothetical protein